MKTNILKVFSITATVILITSFNATSQTIEPRGIYAVIAADEYGYDTTVINQVLANPAVCGITIRQRWRDVEQSEGNYDFLKINDAISRASALNKTVQLIIVPGFYTPDWVLNQIDSCEDDLISPPPIPSFCGKLKMKVPYGIDSGDTLWFPLPWDSLYKQKWHNFLTALALQYNGSSTIVSIAVGGPTSVSCEMTMPEFYDWPRWRNVINLFYPIFNPHRNSNLIFVEEWANAIQFYDTIFTGKTLVVTMANALINFPSYSSVAARDTILEFYKNVTLLNNSKGVQTSGLVACNNYPNDVIKVKELTLNNIIGGSQFAMPASTSPNMMGCDSCVTFPFSTYCSAITPDTAIKKVLRVYFDSTACGNTFGNGAVGSYQMNYLQVYSPDIIYANMNSTAQSLFLSANNCMNGCITTNVHVNKDIIGNVFIYPNPFNNSLSIQFPENDCQLNIIDMLGNVIFEKTFKNKQETIKLNLNSGIYFYQVNNKKVFISSGKIIAQ
ncbi:MAG: T9SS type A sorting domain-containing protein [Bacteroidota bacterium]